MNNKKNENLQKIFFGAIVVAMIVSPIAGALTYLNNDDKPIKTTSTSTPIITVTLTDSLKNLEFKDGNYSIIQNYSSPGGMDSLIIDAVVKDDVLKEISVKTGTAGRESREYNDRFIANYKTKVIGKKIKDIKLTVVSGASLTTEAFNQSVLELQKKAK